MDVRSPKRVRIELDEADTVQDDSDFYSESGSPEKKQHDPNASVTIDDTSRGVAQPLFETRSSRSPVTQDASTNQGSIPGLGGPEPTQRSSLKREHDEIEEEDEADDDLYNGDVNGVEVAVEESLQPAQDDDDLGLTPDTTAEDEPDPVTVAPATMSIDAVVFEAEPVPAQNVIDAPNTALDPLAVIKAQGQKDDADSTVAMNTTIASETLVEPTGDQIEFRFDPSDAQSSSDGDSSDSSDSESDEDEEDGDGILLSAEEQARILMKEAADGDDGPSSDGPLKTANEQTEQFIAKPDIIVTDDMKVTELGIVDKIVSNLAVIKANTSGEYRVLEAGSVLCLENRSVIGAISETLGRVQEPRYTVGFPSVQALADEGVALGTRIFFVEPHSSFVFTQPLRLAKGTDASNIHDEEVPEDELEFSDDEKEAEMKKAAKQAKKDAREGRETVQNPTPSGPSNVARSNMPIPTGPRNKNKQAPAPRKSHPDNVSEQSYSAPISYDDDEDEDMYKPLKRPDNLHEMMSSGPPPPAGSSRGRGSFAQRANRGKGRGRGDFQDRGRGGFSNRGGRGGHKNWKEHGGADRRGERELSASWSSQGGRQSRSPQPPRDSSHSYQQQQHNQKQQANTTPYQRQSHKYDERSQRHQDEYQQNRYEGNSSKSYAPNNQSSSQNSHYQQSSYAQTQATTQQQPFSIPVPPQYQNYSQSSQQPAMPVPPPPQANIPVPNIPNIPPGAHVNPAFFMLQQLAQAHTSTPSPPPPPPPQPPQQQQPQHYGQNAAPGGVDLQQLQQLAALLQGQQQRQQQPPAPPPVQHQAAQPQQYSGWTVYNGAQQGQQQPYRNDDAEARAAQERLNALINSHRPADPRR